MAANQPRQAPPWVRLALRARPANGPAPTPAPEPPPPQPQPLLARPKFRQIGQPQRPPTQSQEPALPAPPPSPLSLPPSRINSNPDLEPKIPLDAEQKTVAIQKTIGKPNDWPWTKGTESGSNFPQARKPTATHISRNEEMKTKGAEVHGKKISSDSEEVGMRVITVAGENKGASMEIFPSPKKNAFEDNSYHRNRKENPNSRSSSDEENNLKTKDKSHKGMPMNAPPMSAFMNSNVQGLTIRLSSNLHALTMILGCTFLFLKSQQLADSMLRIVAMATKASRLTEKSGRGRHSKHIQATVLMLRNKK